MQKIKSFVTKNWILVLLISIDIFFVVLHFATQRQFFFDLDSEWNLPTYYQSIKLFLLAILSISFIYFSKLFLTKRNKVLKFFWSGLTAGAAYLSLDEMVQLHENIASALVQSDSTAVELYVETFVDRGYDAQLWLLFYVPVLLIVITVFAFIFRKLKKGYSWQAYLLIISLVCFSLTFLFEFIGTSDVMKAALGHEYQNWMSLEELAEMVGVSVLCWFVFLQLKKLKLSAASPLS